MGIYLYNLKASKPVRTDDGDVLRYTYLDRLAHGWDGADRQEAQVERLTDRFPLDGPCLVVEDGPNGPKDREGRPVFFQERPEVVYYDHGPTPGVLVGFMRKQGRRWTIATVGEEVTRSTKVLVEYAHRHQLSHDSTLESLYTVCEEHFSRTHGASGVVVVPIADTEDHREIGHAGWLLRILRSMEDA